MVLGTLGARKSVNRWRVNAKIPRQRVIRVEEGTFRAGQAL